MQDRYVGDVGDYGKYALLRALCQPDPMVALGVIWCLFPDEHFNNDGRHVSYLRNNNYALLDAHLYAELTNIVFQGKRSVAAIERSRCLPVSTVFYSAPISAADAMRIGPKRRLQYRAEWLQKCLDNTRRCELVFFDPDNGLEIASMPKHHWKNGKYIYWDELVPFWRRGKSLLIYHHLNRTTSAAYQVEILARRFTANLDGAMVVPLVFRRGSSRVFWLIHHGDDLGRELERRAVEMLNGEWSGHFRPFGWPAKGQVSASTR